MESNTHSLVGNVLTINHLQAEGPITLDPWTYDITLGGLVIATGDPAPIQLLGHESAAFIKWVSNSWRTEFERDLQAYSPTMMQGGRLTTFMPLAIFYHDLCLRAVPRIDDQVAEIVDRVRCGLRGWEAADVDAVLISAQASL